MPSKGIVAMVCITILAGVGIFKGFDGVLLGSAVSALAGLGGYAIGKAVKK